MAKNDAAPAGLTSNALAAKKKQKLFFSAFSAFFQLFSSVLVTVNNFVCNFVRLFLLCSLTQLLLPLSLSLSFCLCLSPCSMSIYTYSLLSFYLEHAKAAATATATSTSASLIARSILHWKAIKWLLLTDNFLVPVCERVSLCMYVCVCVQVHSTVCVCVCCYCLFALLSRYAQQSQRESGKERGGKRERQMSCGKI